MNAGSALDYFVQSSLNWGEQTRLYGAFFLLSFFFFCGCMFKAQYSAKSLT